MQKCSGTKLKSCIISVDYLLQLCYNKTAAEKFVVLRRAFTLSHVNELQHIGGAVMSKLHESGENYLETILVLKNKGKDVRSIDIVREMELSKPSVSRAVGILKNGGFIELDEYGYITLTDAGREIAERIYERHQVFTKWLIDLGVDEKTAAEDACKLEHNISALSFQKLKEHIEKEHK